jgi:hypothetical protein
MNDVTVRGPMSEAELERSAELFQNGYSTGRIAALLGRHRSTVNWALQRMGLKPPQMLERRAFLRKGREVRPFTREEDELLLRRRREGVPYRAILEEMEQRFGYRRMQNTVRMRLIQLENLAEAAIEGEVVLSRGPLRG